MNLVQEEFPAIAGYEIKGIVFSSKRNVVYAAQRTADGLSVILKFLNEHSLTTYEIARLAHEAKALEACKSPLVIKCFGLERHNATPFLVLEDIGGVSLRKLRPYGQISLKDKLVIASKIAGALGIIHKAGVIHRDINPSNILYNESSRELRVIDFGLAAFSQKFQQGPETLGLMEGSIPYIAPEQTGRINRSCDYRSDLYSLGVTLYELFVGAPPFDFVDPLKTIHHHIAKRPTPCDQVVEGFSPVISDIIMKLLSKQAEDRYQSVWSLRADLVRCIESLETTGSIESFAIAASDIPDRFVFPEKLYGREKDASTLLRCFDAVCNGKREVVMIEGPNGIGKSALVRELYMPVAARRGYFISGKFNNIEIDTPASAIMMAFRDLLRQLLTESDNRLKDWKHKILEALGPNSHVLMESLPELQAILGAQPNVPSLSSGEAVKNRYMLAFKGFVQVFCRPEHPLVIFLDDMQWMDSSSIQLLQFVLNDPRIKHLMIIGTSRPQSRDTINLPNHDLEILSSLTTKTINLAPLNSVDITHLLGDCLYAPLKELETLARIVLLKTSGNPFFVEQFLKTLLGDGLIWFDPSVHRFAWDLKGIKSSELTENVVEFLASRIRLLPLTSQKVLQVAACMGKDFDSLIVSSLCHLTTLEAEESLRELDHLGFIRESQKQDGRAMGQLDSPESFCYTFSNSRIQQAAYELLPEVKRREYHYQIGKMLLAKAATDDVGKNIFDIVSQLNAASTLITSSQDLVELTHLNLVAARESMNASAYKNALRFFQKAMDLMPQSQLESHYHLQLALYSEGAEAAFLSSDFVAMRKHIDEVFSRSKSLLDQMTAYRVSVQGAIAENQFIDAARLGRKILAQLGVRFPQTPRWYHIVKALLRVKFKLRRHHKGSKLISGGILAQAPMKNPYALARINFEFTLAQCVFFSNPKLIPLMICDALELSLKYGNAEVTGYIYSCYGMLQSALFRKYEVGMEYGRLGQDLYASMSGTHYEAPLLVSQNVFLRPWVEPLVNTLKPLERAFEAGLEVGDQEFSAHAGMAFCYHSYYVARPLQHLARDMQRYAERIESINQKGGVYILKLYQQLVFNLLGGVASVRLDGPYYHSDDMLKSHEQQNDSAGIFATYFVSMQLLCLFDQFAAAVKPMRLARQHKLSVAGTVHEAQFVFFESLVLLQNTGTISDGGFLRIRSNLRLLRRWSSLCKANFGHRVLLVEAEWARVRGKLARAQRLYDHAIIRARRYGYIQDLALIHELCGRHHFVQVSMVTSGAYLKKAKSYYQKWGALAKVKQLEAQFPELMIQSGGGGLEDSLTASSMASASIDISTLKQALIAIAEEKVHSLMVERIIMTAIQFAGAGRGVLMLRKEDDEFFVEADGGVDHDNPKILQSIGIEDAIDLPRPVINYVINTGESIVLDNAVVPNEIIPGLSRDEYILSAKVRAILCMPIKVGSQGESRIIGILYLENRMAAATFTPQRIEILEIISLAAAGRLELSHKAATDGLTGLYNHEYFQSVLKKEVLQSRRNFRDLSVIMVDIDHFKSVNDQWGHQFGDFVLKKTAATITTVCRKSDVVARYGGEEIGIILPETDAIQAAAVAARLLEAISSTDMVNGGKVLHITASLGVASLSDTIVDADGLVRAADTALYLSKKNGRNRVTQANLSPARVAVEAPVIKSEAS